MQNSYNKPMTRDVSEFETLDKVFCRAMRNIDGEAQAVGGFGIVVVTDEDRGVKVQLSRAETIRTVWFAAGNAEPVEDGEFPNYVPTSPTTNANMEDC